jgi:hypothetical protein
VLHHEWGTILTREQRKAQMCSRCKKFKYPFPTGDRRNHPRNFCDDGVGSTSSIAYPQHDKLFKDNVLDLEQLEIRVTAVLQLSYQLSFENYSSSPSEEDLTLAQFIESRIVKDGGSTLIDISDLKFSAGGRDTSGSSLIERDGKVLFTLSVLEDSMPKV